MQAFPRTAGKKTRYPLVEAPVWPAPTRGAGWGAAPRGTPGGRSPAGAPAADESSVAQPASRAQSTFNNGFGATRYLFYVRSEVQDNIRYCSLRSRRHASSRAFLRRSRTLTCVKARKTWLYNTQLNLSFCFICEQLGGGNPLLSIRIPINVMQLTIQYTSTKYNTPYYHQADVWRETNVQYLENDAHQWVGSTSPIPITMYITLTLTLYTCKYRPWICPGVPARGCMCPSVHVWFHPKHSTVTTTTTTTTYVLRCRTCNVRDGLSRNGCDLVVFQVEELGGTRGCWVHG